LASSDFLDDSQRAKELEQQGHTNVVYPPQPRRITHEDPSWSAGVRRAVEEGRRYLLGLQRPDGHWCAEIEGDTILESEYVLTLYYLGRTGDSRVAKLADYLRAKQLPAGGWALYPGGPADVSSSVKAYFVLKLVGDDPQAEHMRRARAVIRQLGGVERTNSFTKLYLAIFGQYRWDDAPAVPPELILFPNWFPFNIYEMSSWSRAIVVPLSIIWAMKPSCEVPEHARIDELYVAANKRSGHPAVEGEKGRLWAKFFIGVDRIFKLMERVRFRPLRRRAIRKAERWILQRLRKSEGLGAIFPPIINTVIAFDCLGYEQDDPVQASQLHELEKLEIEEDGTLRVQPCKSPLWDTCLALNALGEAEVPTDGPRLTKAVEWILDKEVKEPGDWRVKNPKTPIGGWYFEYANEFYPDIDDTAQILTALAKVKTSGGPEERLMAVSHRAWAWLLGMQNRDGGWASFDRGCDKVALTYIPFADHNAMIDPSTVDITSRVLEAMARWGHNLSAPHVRKAIQYVRDEQEEDGSWFGRWGCNYLYGTYLALWGLRAVGEDMSAEWAQRAADWLRGHQNLDGGWGELPASYDDPALKGRGPSTASQTAWALLGLFSVGDFSSESVGRGVQYLIDQQREDGSWYDVEWTGTGFPKVFYLRYHYYAIYFPLLALAYYAHRLEG
jgi:squalene-hopene/tetraprenyl-beta-curcumene cyclase